MARIPLNTANTSLMARLAAWFTRRRLGREVDPVSAWSHHTGVLLTLLRLETRVERRWRRVDPTLRALAVMLAAARIGCSWCMDFGYWSFHHQGVDARKLEDVPRWRRSAVYSDLERLVLEYAEAMTETPPMVDDAMVAQLRGHLDDAQVVELTALVALENMRSRTNAALGLTSQGFKAECEVRPSAL